MRYLRYGYVPDMLALLVIATLIIASATIASAPPPEANPLTELKSLKAEVEELTKILQDKDEEISILRERNGQLILEVGRLKRLCRGAGIEITATPKAEEQEEKIGEDILKNAPKNVREFLAKWGSPKRPIPDSFSDGIAVGKIGTLLRHGGNKVIQIVDQKNMLVEVVYAYDSYQVGTGITESRFLTRASRTVTKPLKKVIWISDYRTEKFVDGDFFHNTGQLFEIVRSRQYQTVVGGSKTVFEAKPFDLTPYLPKKAAGESDKAR